MWLLIILFLVAFLLLNLLFIRRGRPEFTPLFWGYVLYLRIRAARDPEWLMRSLEREIER